MKEIIANKSTGKLNPLPFVSLAGNCVIWSLYGYLQSDMTVLLPNATGLAFGCLYTAIFAKYNSGECVVAVKWWSAVRGHGIAWSHA